MTRMKIVDERTELQPYDELARAVEHHGEVHAVFEEIDDEVEIRLGTATIYPADDIIEIEDGDTLHVFDLDRLVYWYRPMNAFHE